MDINIIIIAFLHKMRVTGVTEMRCKC